MSQILSVKNVSKFYGTKCALQNVSFTVESGEIVGLLGPNGSGKTTLIKIINTLITDYSGHVLVCGAGLGVESKNAISYLPDVEYLRNDVKINTIIGFYSDFYKDFDAAKAREMLGLVSLREDMRVRSLSKGMKEKLQLTMVMARRARLYVFDEPIAGVDPAARDFILHTIIRHYNQDGAILFSTHLITDVEPIISRVIMLRDGTVVIDGGADELRESRGLSVDQIFREEFKC